MGAMRFDSDAIVVRGMPRLSGGLVKNLASTQVPTLLALSLTPLTVFSRRSTLASQSPPNKRCGLLASLRAG